ncbi:MAG: circadian clock protein KaiA [Elainellaceae cyanobacterium]
MTLKLSVCVFLYDETLRATIKEALQDDAYDIVYLVQPDAFVNYVNHHRQTIDCLLLEETAESRNIFEQLQETEVFLPSVVLLKPETAAKVLSGQQTRSNPSNSGAADSSTPDSQNSLKLSNPEGRIGGVYDAATVYLSRNKLNQLQYAIDQVINRFLKLSPSCTLKDNAQAVDATTDEKVQVSFLLQQKRLAEKLKERLGYLSIYYKRNSKSFLRRMPPEERKAFLNRLKLDYRKIVLNYFSGDPGLNQKIDNFVSAMFFADVSVSQVVEIHMELMDDFSKQLKIEGRSEEILLDYRLTLIDTLANLCEMYRRSVPKEP